MTKRERKYLDRKDWMCKTDRVVAEACRVVDESVRMARMMREAKNSMQMLALILEDQRNGLVP